MIDALFGSKTRVKLLHLFMNNAGKSFYVREITRLIDEQINSVRRELSNMLEVGVIVSESTDNKLYYQVNQQYDFYDAFRSIFATSQNTRPIRESTRTRLSTKAPAWQSTLERIDGIRVGLISGALVQGSAAAIDLLLVGDIKKQQAEKLVRSIEKVRGKQIRYSVMLYDEFYYRLSVRDRFITEILQSKYEILLDKDNVLMAEK